MYISKVIQLKHVWSYGTQLHVIVIGSHDSLFFIYFEILSHIQFALLADTNCLCRKSTVKKHLPACFCLLRLNIAFLICRYFLTMLILKLLKRH